MWAQSVKYIYVPFNQNICYFKTAERNPPKSPNYASALQGMCNTIIYNNILRRYKDHGSDWWQTFLQNSNSKCVILKLTSHRCIIIVTAVLPSLPFLGLMILAKILYIDFSLMRIRAGKRVSDNLTFFYPFYNFTYTRHPEFNNNRNHDVMEIIICKLKNVFNCFYLIQSDFFFFEHNRHFLWKFTSLRIYLFFKR